MCLIKTLKVQFSNFDAFKRAVEFVEKNHGDTTISGYFHVPFYGRFENWDGFHHFVAELSRPDKYRLHDEDPVYGEIYVDVM